MMSTSEKGNVKDIDIPRNARSAFIFDIKDSISDLVKQMEQSTHDWDPVETSHDYSYLFPKGCHDINGAAKIMTGGSEYLEIETAGGYNYIIQEKSLYGNENDKGCEVFFNGPLNGLMNQQLLPKMTYIEGTLRGKFIDSKSQKDLTPFLTMDEYGTLRERKNKKTDCEHEEAGNWLDRWGSEINKKFNNEIKSLPLYISKQELKQREGADSFGQIVSEDELSQKKEDIKQRVANMRKQSSGFVR